MEMPLVSICIPCYNASDFIVETLKSVLSQTYTNLEIIVCDDRSTDRTVEFVKTFEDERIHLYINDVNLGCSANYNQVLSYAKGKYVKLLCADDMITPACIEKQVLVFENNSHLNLVMVTAEKKIIDKKGKVLFSKRFIAKGFIEGKKAIKASVRMGTNIFGEPGLPLLSLIALRQTSGVTEERYFTYCNDFDLWCKMLLLGNIYVIDEKLFLFRVVGGSVTSKTGWQQAQIFKNFLDRMYANKEYNLSKRDIILGKIMANILCFFRNMVYHI